MIPLWRSILSSILGPERPPDIRPPLEMWRALPAFAALAVAVGAACYALAYFIDFPGFSLNLWGAFGVFWLLALGAGHATGRLGQSCRVARTTLLYGAVPLVLLLKMAMAFVVPPDSITEANQVVALIVGWAMLLLVLAVGSRYNDQTVSVSAPLVPGLSLFGLLNILSIDTAIEVAFLVFVAAALFLIAYERMMQRAAAQIEQLRPKRTSQGAQAETREMGRAAVQYLLACAAWFGFFVGGAALLYSPLQAILPAYFPTYLARMRERSSNFHDWRGQNQTMELKGGDSVLSERPVLTVTLRQGASSGLWRGRVYETYKANRWQSALPSDEGQSVELHAIEFTPLQAPSPMSPSIGRRREVTAQVVPREFGQQALFAPGQPIALDGEWRRVKVHRNGTATVSGTWSSRSWYRIVASVPHPRPGTLEIVPGLSASQLQNWHRDEFQNATLSLPPESAARFKAMARQILTKARAQGIAVDTPHRKVLAINNYLNRLCTYSLSSPSVPLGTDGTLFFLTQSKQGACDMFASSMTLLLRAAGVPARLATGYLEPSEEQKAADALALQNEVTPQNEIDNLSSPLSDRALEAPAPREGDEAFLLRERDAHAWVEYYIPGAGWMSFDPTAGTRTTESTLPDQLGQIFGLDRWQRKLKSLWLPILGGAFLLVGGMWTMIDLRRARLIANRAAKSPSEARAQNAYARAVRLLRRHVPRLPHQTPQEYEAAVGCSNLPHEAKQEFAALTHLFVATRYGLGHEADEPQLRASLARLRRTLK